MARAQITTAAGVKIEIEGTPQEIVDIVKKAERQQLSAPRKAGSTPKGKKRRVQLVDLIDSLIDGGFFKKPRDLAAVKAALAELGHHYPVTTLSGAMLAKVRRKVLRRIKEKKRWFYTG